MSNSDTDVPNRVQYITTLFHVLIISSSDAAMFTVGNIQAVIVKGETEPESYPMNSWTHNSGDRSAW